MQYEHVCQNPHVALLGSFSYEIDLTGNVLRECSYPTDHSKLLSNLLTLRKFFAHSSAFYRRVSITLWWL